MNKPLISMRGVTAAYSGKPVLQDVNLDIAPDDFTGVIGPNGGGKTTLLKVILGLIRPTSGSITMNIGKNEIGYLPQVSQFDDQFPITVSDVILSGLTEGLGTVVRRKPGSGSRVRETLEMVGISALHNRPIGELSGGELQRTMLARAVISSPRLLVLDEPNTYVDNMFEQELYRLLEALNKKMAILLVSHDVGMISPYIKSIACVNGRLHFHNSNQITNEQLKVYNCPIELVTHGAVPHRVMEDHKQ